MNVRTQRFLGTSNKYMFAASFYKDNPCLLQHDWLPSLTKLVTENTAFWVLVNIFGNEAETVWAYQHDLHIPPIESAILLQATRQCAY